MAACVGRRKAGGSDARCPADGGAASPSLRPPQPAPVGDEVGVGAQHHGRSPQGGSKLRQPAAVGSWGHGSGVIAAVGFQLLRIRNFDGNFPSKTVGIAIRWYKRDIVSVFVSVDREFS